MELRRLDDRFHRPVGPNHVDDAVACQRFERPRQVAAAPPGRRFQFLERLRFLLGDDPKQFLILGAQHLCHRPKRFKPDPGLAPAGTVLPRAIASVRALYSSRGRILTLRIFSAISVTLLPPSFARLHARNLPTVDPATRIRTAQSRPVCADDPTLSCEPRSASARE